LASVLLNYGIAELHEVALMDNEAISGLPSLSVNGVADALINQGVGTMKVSYLRSSNNLPIQ